MKGFLTTAAHESNMYDVIRHHITFDELMRKRQILRCWTKFKFGKMFVNLLLKKSSKNVNQPVQYACGVIFTTALRLGEKYIYSSLIRRIYRMVFDFRSLICSCYFHGRRILFLIWFFLKNKSEMANKFAFEPFLLKKTNLTRLSS